MAPRARLEAAFELAAPRDRCCALLAESGGNSSSHITRKGPAHMGTKGNALSARGHVVEGTMLYGR